MTRLFATILLLALGACADVDWQRVNDDSFQFVMSQQMAPAPSSGLVMCTPMAGGTVFCSAF